MDPAAYPVPGEQHRVEEEILRSRFITTVARANTADEARALITSVRATFPDARHHCWAYVVGPPGSTTTIGMSDDGEPHGTAGRPMLNVLLHSGVGDVVAVVTRYFGGTLLGKGGLVRAYTGGVQLALASLPTASRVTLARLAIEVEYASVDAVRRLLPSHEAVERDATWGTTVGLRLELPEPRVEGFCKALLDLTRGDALVEVLGDGEPRE